MIEARQEFVGRTAVHIWPVGPAEFSDLPVVVAFHGWTDGGATYGRFAQALSGRCCVVAPDAPGHGGTPWQAAGTYQYGLAATEGVAVLDALPALVGPHGPVVITGHSMGALTAVRVAAMRPGVVSRVIVEEPPRRPLLPWREQRRHLRWIRRLQATDHEGRMAIIRALNTWDDVDREAWAVTKEQFTIGCMEVATEWGEPFDRTVRTLDCPLTLALGSSRESNLTKGAVRRLSTPAGAPVEVLRIAGGHNPRRDALDAFMQIFDERLVPHQPGRGRVTPA